MANIRSIRKVGTQPVYNMTVDDVHNYMIEGNVIVKNCDALRYFCVYWTLPADVIRSETQKKWTDDMWEDYKNANDDDKRHLIEIWGEPK